MNPEDLLSQLRDVRPPTDIGWWPIAPGWWMLGIFVVISLVSIIYFSRKKYQKNAWRRQALASFIELKARYLDSPSAASISEINSLLKRAIASANSDNTYLSKTGESWAKTLTNPMNIEIQTTIILNDEVIKLLSFDQYRKTSIQLDLSSLNSIEKWIKHLN